MKTINDIFELIAQQVVLNDGKALHFVGSIDTEHEWVSWKSITANAIVDDYLSHFSIDTPEKIQQAYWTIYNNSRQENK